MAFLSPGGVIQDLAFTKLSLWWRKPEPCGRLEFRQIRQQQGEALKWNSDLVLGEVLVLVGIGVAVGVPAAPSPTRLARSMLYGVEPRDPATLAGAVLLMAGFAALAGYLPARVYPMVALRCE